MGRLEMLKKEKAQIEARLKEISAEIAKIKRENPLNKERDTAIWEMRERGETYQEIASVFDISAARARDICVNVKRQNKLDTKFPDFVNLSKALRYILIDSNVSTKAEIIDCLNDKNGFAIRAADFGNVRHRELDDFIGMNTIIVGRKVFISKKGYNLPCYILKGKEEQNAR